MLSPAQQLAATTPGHVLIAACPGSGKTTVLKHRAQYLLEQDDGSRLAAVTFTREAAESLRERIVSQFRPAAKRMDAGTFHSLCIGQLTASNRRVTICTGGKTAMLIRGAIARCPLADPGLKYEDYLAAIEAWQREVTPSIPPAESSPLSFVYREYNADKRRMGLMDFGDIMRETVIGMRAGTVPPLRVQYMLVDEFQDTDAMQLAWCLEHAARGVHVTIVGDDDQSIYGFRGSLGYEGMLDFQRTTGATLINLDRTYRCSREILQPAARLISGNPARVAKSLMTASSAPGQVLIRGYEDREAEADALIAELALADDPSSWAILARTNSQLEVIECRIGDRFPFVRKKGESFWELRAPALLLGLASSLGRGDMLGVSDLLTAGGVSKSFLDGMASQFQFERPGALSRFCETRLPRGGGDRAFVAHIQESLQVWREMVGSGKTSQVKMAVGGMATTVLKYGRWSERELADTESRLSNAARSLSNANGSMSQRVQALTRKNQDKNAAGVALLTLHASKGLEYDNVWMVGVDTGTLPSVKEGSDVQEERRLAYVGMTRARTKLVMSYAQSNTASPFLAEAGLMHNALLSRPAA